MSIVSGPKPLNDELAREYILPNGAVYRIEEPVSLWVGTTTHRVLDSKGIVHCIPFPNGGNTILRWTPKDAANPVSY